MSLLFWGPEKQEDLHQKKPNLLLHTQFQGKLSTKSISTTEIINNIIKKIIDQVSGFGKFRSPGVYAVQQDQSFKGYKSRTHIWG